MGIICYLLFLMELVEQKMLQASLLKDAHRYLDAIALFHEVLAIEPENLDAIRQICICNMYWGTILEARMMIERMMQVNPEYDSVYFLRAKLGFRTGYLEEALVLINKAIELNPVIPQYYTARSKYITQKGAPFNGHQQAMEALKLNPEYSFGWAALADAQSGLKQFEEAHASLLKAISIKPEFYYFYYLMGNLYKEMGNASAAIGMYEEALKLWPEYKEAMQALKSIRFKIERKGWGKYFKYFRHKK